ncbi:MAG: sugar ABC transporter permease [Bacillota bacterium]|nr:sugar ABC transporter permease [Bacillota bacterium]
MLKRLQIDDKYGRYGYFFIFPFFVAMLLFTAYPLVYSIYLSFTKWDGSTIAPAFIGIDNFKHLVKDHFFWDSILNTFKIWLFAVTPQMIFAIILAVVLNDKKLKGKGIFRAVYFFPALVTAVSIAGLFFQLFAWQGGTVNNLLISLGISTTDSATNFFGSIFWTRFLCSFLLWWLWFGYSMIIFMAGIKAIPEELYEAGDVDGAGWWKKFRYITLPSLRPTILYNIVTSIIGGLAIFDVPYMLTSGTGAPDYSAQTISMYLYSQTFQANNYGYGASIGVGLCILTTIFVIIAFKFINRDVSID